MIIKVALKEISRYTLNKFNQVLEKSAVIYNIDTCCNLQAQQEQKHNLKH